MAPARILRGQQVLLVRRRHAEGGAEHPVVRGRGARARLLGRIQRKGPRLCQRQGREVDGPRGGRHVEQGHRLLPAGPGDRADGPERDRHDGAPPADRERLAHRDRPPGRRALHAVPLGDAASNKLLTGGIVEFRASCRGRRVPARAVDLRQPRRAVFQSNTGQVVSYDQCDADLVLPPTDPPQRISACDDQPPSSGLIPFQGRGATELDVLEGAVTNAGTGSCAARHSARPSARNSLRHSP